MEWQIREEESKLKVLSDWERSGGSKKEAAESEAKLAVKRGMRSREAREKLGSELRRGGCATRARFERKTDR